MTAETNKDIARRHLRLLYNDFDEQRKAYRLAGTKVADADRQLQTLKERLKGRFKYDDIAARIAYLDVVRASARAMGKEADEFEYTWRLASASTHGKRWAVFENNDIEVLDEYEEGQYRVARTPRLDGLVRMLGIAYEVVQYGVAEFAARAGVPPSDYQERLRKGVLSVTRELPMAPENEGERDKIVRLLESS